jgi:ABC-type transport system involved in multi-copper enzyme maturation permease subunit
MSPFEEVRLVAGRELQKSFRSRKGLVLATLSVGGGGGLSVLFAWIDRLRVEHLPSTVDPGEMQRQLYTQVYGAEVGKFLTPLPYVLWFMLIATLGALPLLVALLGFDGVSAELQHRTARYWVVRVRRSAYVAGKFVGLWATVLAVTLAMNAIVWGAVVGVGHQPFDRVIGWGASLFAVVVPISAAWCGVATLVGSQFRVPMLALLSICAATFALWFVHIVAVFKGIDALDYVYPNTYDRLLLSPSPASVALGVAGVALIAVATTLAAALAFERRDL